MNLNYIREKFNTKTTIAVLVSIVCLVCAFLIQSSLSSISSETNASVGLNNNTKNYLNLSLGIVYSIFTGIIFNFIFNLIFKKDEEERMNRIIQQHFSYYLPGVNVEPKSYFSVKSIDSLEKVKIPDLIYEDCTVIKLMFISFDFKLLNKDTINKLSKLLNHNSKIQLLLLHPHSSAFRARCEERNKGKEDIDIEYYEKRTLGNHINLFNNFQRLFKNNDEKVEIKFMYSYPTYVYMSVSNFMWFTPVWTLESTINMPIICLNNEASGIFEGFSKHFDDLWELPDNVKVKMKDLSETAKILYNTRNKLQNE